jgi:hypothetical protein
MATTTDFPAVIATKPINVSGKKPLNVAFVVPRELSCKSTLPRRIDLKERNKSSIPWMIQLLLLDHRIKPSSCMIEQLNAQRKLL